MLIDIIAASERDIFKLASIIEAILNYKQVYDKINYRLIFTGKLHYNDDVLAVFRQLNIPVADIALDIEEQTEATLLAAVMVRYEKVAGMDKPDVVIATAGSTPALGCLLTAAKLGIKTIHLEAGAPVNTQEASTINYRLIDGLADCLMTTSHYANEHLRRNNVAENRIFLSGNTFIDTFQRQMGNFKQPVIWRKYKLEVHKYFMVRLQENISTSELRSFLQCLIAVIPRLPILVFGTMEVLQNVQLAGIKARNLFIHQQLPVNEANYLLQYATGVITDSDWWQDETTYMRIPCITLQNNTFKPETVHNGTNELAGRDIEKIATAIQKITNNTWKRGNTPYMWDGKAAKRVLALILNLA